MSKFFKGWRRKIGVMTLLMALSFTSDWIACLGKWSADHRADTYSLHCGEKSSDVYIFGLGKPRWIALNESLIWTSRYKGHSRSLSS